MVVLLLLVIIAVLLFGAAAVRSVIGIAIIAIAGTAAILILGYVTVALILLAVLGGGGLWVWAMVSAGPRAQRRFHEQRAREQRAKR